jgi:hypothetical protein
MRVWRRMGARGWIILAERERDGWFKGVDCVYIVSVV